MKTATAFVLAAALLAIGAPSASWAYDPYFGHRFERGRWDSEELRQFNTFLHSHPGISKDLSANPNLANDRGYLRRHGPLKKFLERYPNVRDELGRNPGRFLARTYRYADYR